jgi:tetratricopeptide (TPR) repeat protein
VPRSIDAACLAALDADPEARPGPGELAAALEAMAAEPGASRTTNQGSRSTILVSLVAASLGLATGILSTGAIARIRAEKKDRETEAETAKMRASLLDATKLASDHEVEAKQAREVATSREAEARRERELGAAFLEQLEAERVSWGDDAAGILDGVIRALAVTPPTAATARLRARLLLNRGRYEDALSFVREGLARPELAREPELLRVRADACFAAVRRARDGSRDSSGLISECQDALRHLEEVDRDGARGIYASVKRRELFEHARPDHEAVVQELERARSLDPNFAAAPLLEAEILSGVGEREGETPERVLALMEAAIRADPTEAESYYKRSAVYWMQCLAAERPGAPPPRDLQDRCIRDLKYARAIDLWSYHFVEEGKLYTMLGRPREAPAALEAALARASRGSFEWISALTWRGNMKVLLGDERGAVDDWVTAGEMEPGAAHELYHYRHRLSAPLEAELERRAPKLTQFRDDLAKAAESSDPGERAQARSLLEDMNER